MNNVTCTAKFNVFQLLFSREESRWALVHFADETVEVAPITWLRNDDETCMWPSSGNPSKMASTCNEVTESFLEHAVKKVLLFSGT